MPAKGTKQRPKNRASMSDLVPGLQGVLFIGLMVILSIAGILLMRRFAPQAMLAQHNELAGFVIAVVGVVYAVLLAFMALAAWERFGQAEIRTYDEANNLANLYRDVGPLPGGHQMRNEIIAYTNTVVADEWPKMRSGGESAQANMQLEQVGRQLRHVHIANAGQQDLQMDALARLNTVLLDRDDRLSMSADALPRMIWIILLCGAAVTIGFTFLFGFQRLELHIITTSLLTITIGLSLFLIYSVDAPFARGISIEPRAFERALHTYELVGR